jgi:radical SAM/Cys-rich protein
MISASRQSKKFLEKTKNCPLKKEKISVLQVNLGRRCNLACSHCHVEAGPHRTEECTDETVQNIISVIQKFPQIETVDLTGGAPEMNNGFTKIVIAARKQNKEVIVRSNLTIYFEEGFSGLPKFFADQQVRIVASLPCYLEQNVDAMRGNGVFEKSIKAIKMLNEVDYGETLQLDLVYNPALPKTEKNFSLAPCQQGLEKDYKKFLGEKFGISFNSLIAITNLPVGRFQKYLERKKLEEGYIDFLAENFNSATLPGLMCKNQWSVDYDGFLYDCDFHQIEKIHARGTDGKKLHLTDLLEKNSLDIGGNIPIRNFCLGCTAGSGSSCGGAIN